MSETDEAYFHRSDGRLSEPACKECGEEDLLVGIDPVADEVVLGCPNCREDIIVGDIRLAEVELSFTTGGVDEIDPALRGMVEEEMDDE